ncbi:MAG: prepilin-type N-terminal cleavage/methylation domain-containing protein [Verrucomicrobia bacterium]|nr:prepilin-type N-terminal cleavage/methylation domain-containing protein [Verrucomicrobiota bacterium]
MSRAALPRRRGAFTLIEIMIAITLFALVIAAMYSSWWAIVRATRTGQTAAAEAQRSRIALRTVVQALTGVQMYLPNIRFYSFDVDTSSDFAALSLVSRLPESFPGSGVFGDHYLRRVTFTVEPDKDGTNQLVMRQMPLLEATNTDQEPYAIVLARDVNVFMLEFWDSVRNDWGTDWLLTNRLPYMVRVTLATGGPHGKIQAEDIATREIVLTAIPIPLQYQIVGGPMPFPPGGPFPGGQPFSPVAPGQPGYPGQPFNSMQPVAPAPYAPAFAPNGQ